MLTVKDTVLKPLASKQRITDLSSSTSLTVPAHATMAFLQAETQNVRWWDDGSTPTATEGHLIYAGDIGFWYTGNLKAIRLIGAVSGAILTVSYYQ